MAAKAKKAPAKKAAKNGKKLSTTQKKTIKSLKAMPKVKKGASASKKKSVAKKVVKSKKLSPGASAALAAGLKKAPKPPAVPKVKVTKPERPPLTGVEKIIGQTHEYLVIARKDDIKVAIRNVGDGFNVHVHPEGGAEGLGKLYTNKGHYDKIGVLYPAEFEVFYNSLADKGFSVMSKEDVAANL